MSNSHQERFLTKLLIGIGCIMASIFVIMFVCFERTKYDEWYYWGLLSSVLMVAGVVLCGSAFVHKMKSDLIKRQRSNKEQNRSSASGN
jgi:cytochrome bd-type quinol oxidase subunit 1